MTAYTPKTSDNRNNLPSSLSSLSTYIPITTLTSPDFNPYIYANSLVKSINSSSGSGVNTSSTAGSDQLVDLTTPLQKTLFDLQEVDTAIHSLTSQSALEILTYTSTQNEVAQRILSRVDEERVRLVSDFERLRGEVLGRYERAEKARIGAERSLKVVKLMRGVQRVVGLARRFEGGLADAGIGTGREGHREIVRAANVLLEFREFMDRPGGDVAETSRVNVVKTLRGRVFEDGEAKMLDWARKVVREFSASSLVSAGGPGSASTLVTMGASTAGTYRDAEEARARFTSAVHTLYLLSPAPRLEGGRRMKKEEFEAEYLLRALQGYLTSSVTSSAGGIGRGLSQLPLLERALLEVSARCQSVIALSVLLEDIAEPQHVLLDQNIKTRRKSRLTTDDMDSDEDSDNLENDEDMEQEVSEGGNLLSPLLSSLDTASLASYFWRSLSSALTIKVQEIINRGGVSARTLRTNKDTVRAEIRDCVLRGSKMPSSLMGHNQTGSGKEQVVGNWEREAAVMVGSVIAPLSR